MHCDSVTAHNAIDVCKVVAEFREFRETTDELQIGDPGFEVESGYFNETVHHMIQC
jgi:hypothetical protein